jgi:hypothetical protein
MNGGPAQSPPDSLFFFLIKRTKNQDSGNASFAARAFTHIMQNHGPQEFAPALARTWPRFRQIRFPFHPQASIVLHDLSGSRTAVGSKKRSKSNRPLADWIAITIVTNP